MPNITRLLFVAAALLAFAFSPTTDAKPLRAARISHDFAGTITKVSDGDTYIVRRSDGSEVKVRLHFADCPEIAHKDGEVDQPNGREALQAATNLLLDKQVTVHQSGLSYGRIVGDVMVGPVDVATILVSSGNAWVDPRYKPRAALVEAQADAKAKHAGLWSDPAPVPPWEWRKNIRDKQVEARK